MKKLSIAIIDTYPNKNLATLALTMASRLPNINKIYTFSDLPYYPGAEFVQVPIIKSNNSYGEIALKLLPRFIEDEYVLVIQWDGFPLFPQNWNPQFFDYDFIGAPVLQKSSGGIDWVGNGGFSLRSQKLLQAIERLNIGIENTNQDDQPEDAIICIRNKFALEEEGVIFAPIDVASQFSYQAGNIPNKILGFHSIDNLPIFFSENELVPIANEIVERIFQPTMLLRYLEVCMKRNYLSLFKESVSNYEKKPNLCKAIHIEQRVNPRGGFLELIKRFN